MNYRKQTYRFTLLELLITISVIVILLAMILPALGMARKRARTITCVSNFKTVGYAFALYTDGNDGYMPWRGISGGTYNVGTRYYLMYLSNAMNFKDSTGIDSLPGIVKIDGTRSKLACPAFDVDPAKDSSDKGTYTLGYNENLDYRELRGAAAPIVPSKCMRGPSFSRPGTIIVLGDMAAVGTAHLRRPYATNPDGGNMPKYRHLGQTTFLFGDFHVSLHRLPATFHSTANAGAGIYWTE